MNEDTATDATRRRNPRGQGGRLREDILAAVARLLDKKLSENPMPVSLREVAREVGIAAQSMYLHFADKDQLARAVAEDGYQRVVTAMQQADARAADSGADASERLRAQALAFCAFSITDRGVTRLMYGNDAATFGEPGQVHPVEKLWQQWLDAFRACEEGGLRWPHGAEGAAMLMWSALFGRFALWTSTFGQTDPQTLIDFANSLADSILRDARR